MVLSKEDYELFYGLFFPLLNFVNEKYKINGELGKMYLGREIAVRDVMEIARRLWNDTSVIDEYLSLTELSVEGKNIVSGWKKKISGDFFVERHLKKGSVFISSENNEVYLVSGLRTCLHKPSARLCDNLLSLPALKILEIRGLPLWGRCQLC